MQNIGPLVCVTDIQHKSTRHASQTGHAATVSDTQILAPKTAKSIITDALFDGLRVDANGFNTSTVYESSAVVMTTHQPIKAGDVVKHCQSRALLEAQLLTVGCDTMTQRFHKPEPQTIQFSDEFSVDRGINASTRPHITHGLHLTVKITKYTQSRSLGFCLTLTSLFFNGHYYN